MRSRSGVMVLAAFATRYQLGFSFQAGLVMGVVNTLAAVSICACAMNSACSRGKLAAKSAGKLAGSRKTKPSGVLTKGFEELGELLAVGALSFTFLRRVRRDVNQGDDMGVSASLCDHGPAVAVPNQDARARLAIKDTLGRGDILRQRSQWLLYKCDVVPVLHQNVVHAFPARAVDKGTMHQHDVLDRRGQRGNCRPGENEESGRHKE